MLEMGTMMWSLVAAHARQGEVDLLDQGQLGQCSETLPLKSRRGRGGTRRGAGRGEID